MYQLLHDVPRLFVRRQSASGDNTCSQRLFITRQPLISHDTLKMGGSQASSKVNNGLKDPGLVSFLFAILDGLAFHHDFMLTVIPLDTKFSFYSIPNRKERT